MSTPSNSNPLFVAKLRMPAARLTALNTAADGSGTLGTDIFQLDTSGVDGTKIQAVTFRNSQATPALSTAMRVCVFKTDSSGNNPRIVGEGLLPAATRSNTVLGAAVTVWLTEAGLINGEKLLVCKSAHAGAQDQVDAFANNGDF